MWYLELSPETPAASMDGNELSTVMRRRWSAMTALKTAST